LSTKQCILKPNILFLCNRIA